MVLATGRGRKICLGLWAPAARFAFLVGVGYKTGDQAGQCVRLNGAVALCHFGPACKELRS